MKLLYEHMEPAHATHELIYARNCWHYFLEENCSKHFHRVNGLKDGYFLRFVVHTCTFLLSKYCNANTCVLTKLQTSACKPK